MLVSEIGEPDSKMPCLGMHKYLKRGTINMYQVNTGPTYVVQTRSCHRGLAVPSSLFENVDFQRCLRYGKLDNDGYNALAIALGIDYPSDGFYHWANQYWLGNMSLDRLYSGRCNKKLCRIRLTCFDPPHFCGLPNRMSEKFQKS